MNLDILISKYLDGELSVEEDQELRRLVSDSHEAKSAFDSSVSLHLALKADANALMPPPDLVRETEERILMTILAQEPPVSLGGNVAVAARRVSTALLLLLLIPLLLPFTTASIHDGFLNLVGISLENKNISSDHDAKTSAEPLEIIFRAGFERQEKNIAAKRTDVPKNNGNDERIPRSVARSDDELPALLLADSQKNPTITDLPSPEETLSVQAITLKRESAFVSQTNLATNRFSAPVFSLNTLLPALLPDKNIFITTSFGSDFIANAMNGKAMPSISFVSQSLAYSLNEKQRAGLEFGHISFTYKNDSYRFIPKQASAASISTRKSGNGKKNTAGMQSQETPDGGEGDGTSIGEYIPITQIVNKNTLFGAIFYEQALYQSGKITAQGRFGLGGSNEGALAYLRGVGAYDVMNNVSVFTGFDARLMFLSTPYKTNAPAKSQYGISFMYGFQVKF